MAGAEENGAAIGDWRAPIPSPNSFFSAFLPEDVVSRSCLGLVNGAEPALADAEKENIRSEEKSDNVAFSGGFWVSSDYHKEALNLWKPPTGRNGGSIAERRAAKGGFNAPRLNTARFRCISPLSSPSVCSPYLTIPPGLSPTTLLDSPVMLPNSQAQPSPTTGTFPLSPFSHESLMSVPLAFDEIKDTHEDGESSFVFKPHVKPVSLLYLPSKETQVSSTSNQAKEIGMDGVQCPSVAQVPSQIEFECQGGFPTKATAKDNKTDSSSDLEVSDNMIVPANPIPSQSYPPCVTNDPASPHEEQLHGEDAALQLEGDEKGSFPPLGMGRPSEDGYNWRKYGQKQVKGSEFPRSYYKCTHPNCQVKKKVERSHDGQVTEIIYKGDHNHPKPQPSRRAGIGLVFALNEMPERPEGLGSYVKVEGGSMWRSIQQGSNDKSGMDWNGDALERTSSTSAVTEVSDPLSTSHGKHLCLLESADTPELSSTLASHDDEEDRTTQGSISLGDNANDEESDSKRRKKDSPPIETNMASRAVREPRVVVQTTSEVDILDDGYRWRKYGQKVVKGNPNPRSYYKCTNAGCSVRKHVERASHDLKSVITTYEGKHNHEVPAARNSSHCNNSGTGNPPHSQTAISGHPPSNHPKPEPRVQDLAPQFERNPKQLSNEYLKPGYLGNPISSDIKLGVSSTCYEMKLPPLQPLAFSPFRLNTNLKENPQAASLAQVAPDFLMPFPTSLSHRSANLALAGLGFNGKPVNLVQSFLGQQAKESEMKFLRPKEEQEEPVYETPRLPMNHPSSVSSSVYQQIMGGFPL